MPKFAVLTARPGGPRLKYGPHRRSKERVLPCRSRRTHILRPPPPPVIVVMGGGKGYAEIPSRPGPRLAIQAKWRTILCGGLPVSVIPGARLVLQAMSMHQRDNQQMARSSLAAWLPSVFGAPRGAGAIRATLPRASMFRGPRWRSGQTTRLPPMRTRCSIPGRVAPGFSYVGIVLDYVVGRRVFSGIFRYSLPCIPVLPHTRLASSSYALNTSMLRAAHISVLTRWFARSKGMLEKYGGRKSAFAETRYPGRGGGGAMRCSQLLTVQLVAVVKPNFLALRSPPRAGPDDLPSIRPIDPPPPPNFRLSSPARPLSSPRYKCRAIRLPPSPYQGRNRQTPWEFPLSLSPGILVSSYQLSSRATQSIRPSPFSVERRTLFSENFADDNARCHVSRATMQWYADNNVRRLDCPVQSPDLNPIEHLRDGLDRRVRTRQARPESIAQLMEWLQEEW
ncbi:hypothetical protein PR048_023944 [Dryococelus australis]|uniref:Tc1-like transposase DDE domain-containing protein n=1 Tax=Dryococelus australis TaxID=614101 RepID=A0ABQ9GVL7_9NEOP|nr:hypothetical protein PR048_023944 [Dryococelus australis]